MHRLGILIRISLLAVALTFGGMQTAGPPAPVEQCCKQSVCRHHCHRRSTNKQLMVKRCALAACDSSPALTARRIRSRKSSE
jgi:hypothetical protein